MSDLFRYLYNECVNNCGYRKKYNTLCNYLYGTFINKYSTFCDGHDDSYCKRVLYGEKQLSKFCFNNKNNRIRVRSYKNDNKKITYIYRDKILYVNTIYYTKLGRYDYFDVHCADNIYYRGIPYNIMCYSPKSKKTIYINTETKQCEIKLFF